mgnify:FL=1
MRWTASLIIFCTAGCSGPLSVITKQVNIIDTADFSIESPSTEQVEIDFPVDSIEQVVEDIDETAIMVDDAISRAEEFDDLMMPKLIGIPLRVEALVGQVNGRPVYANTVLDPVADQISALAIKLTRTELENYIRKALYQEQETMGVTMRGGRMYELVVTDLLLSEAIGGLSKEQSIGLIAIVKRMRNDYASTHGGSQSQAREAIERESGVTVDKFLRSQRDQILIDALYREKIWPKVSVTWRDIQREFEQLSVSESAEAEISQSRTNAILDGLQRQLSLISIEEAKGSITIGRISVPKDDERIDLIHEAFSNGASFDEVAEMVGAADGGVWEVFELHEGGIETTSASQKVKEHLAGTEVGEVKEPLELGRNLMWLAVLEIQHPVSLYNRDIQIAMQNTLRWLQFNREKDRYVESLWGDGTLEELKKMAESVTAIAVQRYQQ